MILTKSRVIVKRDQRISSHINRPITQQRTEKYGVCRSSHLETLPDFILILILENGTELLYEWRQCITVVTHILENLPDYDQPHAPPRRIIVGSTITQMRIGCVVANLLLDREAPPIRDPTTEGKIMKNRGLLVDLLHQEVAWEEEVGHLIMIGVVEIEKWEILDAIGCITIVRVLVERLSSMKGPSTEVSSILRFGSNLILQLVLSKE